MIKIKNTHLFLFYSSQQNALSAVCTVSESTRTHATIRHQSKASSHHQFIKTPHRTASHLLLHKTQQKIMRGHRCTASSRVETESDTDSDSETMRCISCKEYYGRCDAGTCKECYEEASETEEELKREIDDLKAKVAFLRFWSPLDHHITYRSSAGPCFTDVVLVASSDDGLTGTAPSVPVPAHKAVLVNTQFPNFVILDQLDGNWLAIYWLILSWLSEFHYLLIRQWSWHLLDIYVILFIVIMWDNRFHFKCILG